MTGLVVMRNGREISLRARSGIVLTTGGFPNDPKRRREFLPSPTELWSMAPADNTGDGLRLGEAAGATVRSENASNVFHAPISILTKSDGSVVRYPHLVWDRTKPGLMAVNGAGRRFVNEATSYHEFGLAMYESHRIVPTIPAFPICDANFIARWGLGLALPGGRSFRHLVRSGHLHEAPSLAALAGKLGIDPAALADSAAGFNAGAETGQDPLGKGATAYNRYLGDPTRTDGHPNLGTLAVAPFYAVKVYPGDIGTAGGIVTDENARVLDARPADPRPLCCRQRRELRDGRHPPRSGHHAWPRPDVRLAGRTALGLFARRWSPILISARAKPPQDLNGGITEGAHQRRGDSRPPA